MIFLTIGTDLVFNRMIKIVDEWASKNSDVEIIAQVGLVKTGDYHPKYMTEKSMLAPNEYNKYCKEAEFFIAHAGMGSIITALTMRKPIVLFPRRAKYNEHRNDHQLATAEKFSSRNGIFVAWNDDEISNKIQAARDFSINENMNEFDRFAPTDLTNKISEYIMNI